MTEPEALVHLMGAYFHQDWDLDHSDEWEVLLAFERDEPELSRQLPDEIAQVLARFQAEPELEQYLVRGLGADYNARYNGGTYRAWLQQISDRVRATLER
ncbi:MAG TPA: contact-dependent growth inhibition system immunity protein [Nocardioides sp.]|nr:contact-dependent growth inhibition system immunity protein [Nocardioides sp.]